MKDPKASSRTQRTLEFPFYPALLALFIPVETLARNIAVFTPLDATRSAIAFLLGALLVFGASLVILRRIHLSALITATLIGVMSPQFSHLGTDVLSKRWAILLMGVVIVSYSVYRWSIGPKAAIVLNVVALALLSEPVSAILRDKISDYYQDPGALHYSPISSLNLAASTAPRPSIIHIVLDGYSANDVLKEIFAFDNGPFSDALEDLGFVIANNTRAPYNQTLYTMSAIFSGTYLRENEPPIVQHNDAALRSVLGRIVARGPVHRQLERLGYRFLFTDTGYKFFQGFAKYGTVTAPSFGPFGLNLFEQFLIDRTNFRFVQKLAMKFLKLTYSKSERMNEIVRHAVTTKFYRDHRAPFFLYEHVLAPHPPFTVDRIGRMTTKWLQHFGGAADGDHVTLGNPELQAQYKAGYLEKLRYINQAILKQVTSMIQDIPAPKIIIIHGDHGSGAYLFHNDPDRTCLKERMSPFLAIYTDNLRLRQAFAKFQRERFNLVNLYRIIFDASFGTDLGTADDRSYFLEWDSPKHPHRLGDKRINRPCINSRP